MNEFVISQVRIARDVVLCVTRNSGQFSDHNHVIQIMQKMRKTENNINYQKENKKRYSER